MRTLWGVVGTETRAIEAITPPREGRVRATGFDLRRYRCQHCGHEFSIRHEVRPRVGEFGPGLLVFVTMLKHHPRGPIRRVQVLLRRYSDLAISPKGVHDVPLRVGDACRGEHERTPGRVRAARWSTSGAHQMFQIPLQYVFLSIKIQFR